MIQRKLQPYRKFEVAFINQLIKQGSNYLVCPSCRRANEETDYTKAPVLFTPYIDLSKAVQHTEHLKGRGDQLAVRVDIHKEKVHAKLVDMCCGLTDKVPYIAIVGSLEWVNRYIDLNYYEKLCSYVRKNRQDWDIKQPNSLRPFFETVMSEPMVKINWGRQWVIASLEEPESL